VVDSLAGKVCKEFRLGTMYSRSPDWIFSVHMPIRFTLDAQRSADTRDVLWAEAANLRNSSHIFTKAFTQSFIAGMRGSAKMRRASSISFWSGQSASHRAELSVCATPASHLNRTSKLRSNPAPPHGQARDTAADLSPFHDIA